MDVSGCSGSVASLVLQQQQQQQQQQHTLGRSAASFLRSSHSSFSAFTSIPPYNYCLKFAHRSDSLPTDSIRKAIANTRTHRFASCSHCLSSG
jgi:hypothetical protein